MSVFKSTEIKILKEIVRVQSERIYELEKALEFYADKKLYSIKDWYLPPIVSDEGKIARKARGVHPVPKGDYSKKEMHTKRGDHDHK